MPRWWSETFGGSDYDGAYSVQQTSDDGYIAAGVTSSFGAGMVDVYLVKTDQSGREVWSRTFGGISDDWSFSVQQTSDGGYVAAGYTFSLGAGVCDMYLLKTDRNGDELWAKTFGGTVGDSAYSVQQTSDGGYIVAGSTWSFGVGLCDLYLVKTGENGSEVWSKTFGGSDWEEAYCVQQTSDDGYILVGSTKSFGEGEGDVYLIKTDQNGNEVWSKTFGGSANDGAWSVQQTSDGGYIVAGYTRSFGAGEADVYLIKTDENGSETWSRTLGGSGSDRAVAIRQTPDGGYIVAGETYSFGAGAGDAYVIKTHPHGYAPQIPD